MRGDDVGRDPAESKLQHSRPLDEDEVAAILTGLQEGFDGDAAAISDVGIVMGSGAKVRIHNGRLHAEDGEGWFRRTREWGRVDAPKRLILAASTGYLSLSVLSWAQAVGTEVVVVDSDFETVLGPAGGTTDARTLRVQAAPPPGLALAAAKLCLVAKITGQSHLLRQLFRDEHAATTLDGIVDGLDDADDVDACRLSEAVAASCYWNAWNSRPETSVRFTKADAAKVPQHWMTFTERRSPLSSGTARKAVDPLNCMLNLSYHFAGIATRSALLSVGIHPSLPFALHADQRGKDAAVFDAVECVRPAVDYWLLTALVAERTFSRKDFVEASDASVRVAPKLVQQIAASVLPLSARVAGRHCEALSHLLRAAVSGKTPAMATPLTRRNAKRAAAEVQARKIAASRASAAAPPAQARSRRARLDQGSLFANCVSCAAPLSRSRDAYCLDCLDRLPNQAREARRRRGQSIAMQRARLEEWRTANPDARGDPDEFEPIRAGLLAGKVTLRQIMQSCAVSKTTASGWRSGRATPSYRHWATLRRLGT
jgi:CRISPR/Cas system-associated endonuclease Cas1